MKNYSEMSDFEINILASIYMGLGHVKMVVNDTFNPCKNPSDVWSIIQDYKIRIQYSVGDTYTAETGEELSSITVNDKNPRRAALIVFLMMKEAGA